MVIEHNEMFIYTTFSQHQSDLERFIIKGLIMRSGQIGQINEALFVLRHFIDLSAKLLPFLYELQNKRCLSSTDMLSRDKIIQVYRNYSFDTRTSELLINSDILCLIKESFEKMEDNQSTTRARRKATLDKFLSEYDRLVNNWNTIVAN